MISPSWPATTYLFFLTLKLARTARTVFTCNWRLTSLILWKIKVIIMSKKNSSLVPHWQKERQTSILSDKWPFLSAGMLASSDIAGWRKAEELQPHFSWRAWVPYMLRRGTCDLAKDSVTHGGVAVLLSFTRARTRQWWPSPKTRLPPVLALSWSLPQRQNQPRKGHECLNWAAKEISSKKIRKLIFKTWSVYIYWPHCLFVKSG